MSSRSQNNESRILGRIIVVSFLFLSPIVLAAQERIGDFERSRNREMLRVAKDEIIQHYFDPNFRGVDIQEKFKVADEMLKQVATNSESFYVIAAFFRSLNDSHTTFFPPNRAVKIEREWRMQMFGDKCFVTSVKPGSQAEKDGIHIGDEVLAVEKFAPTVEDFWKINYLLYVLNPISEFNLVLRSPAEEPKRLLVHDKAVENPRVTDLTIYNEYMNLVRDEERQQRLNAHRFVEVGNDLIIWKMPQFDLVKIRVDDMMDKVRKRKLLVLDLRGNGGGYEETLLRLLGYFTDTDLTVGSIVRRKETKPMVAKSMGSRIFKGELVVLVDSESASASEVFARAIQLNRRGLVIGDRSAGKVMRSIFYPKQVGVDTRVVFYGFNITDANLLMSDGKGLENIGVAPNEIVLPTGAQLRASEDPVLSRAAALLGVELPPDKAGTLFPVLWK